MVHVITTYGGGEVFEYVFNGLAMLMKSNGGVINPMSHIVLVVGALYVTTVMFFKNDLRDGAWWFMWALVATSLMTTIKTTVWINDPLANRENKVDNVPYVLAVAASTVSKVGKIVTEEIESKFTLPDDLKYHKTGTVFASALMSQVKNFRITDPIFYGNIEDFVNQCIKIPVGVGTKINETELHNSKDIWEYIKERASPILTFQYKEGNNPATSMTCKAGAIKLDGIWKDEIEKATLIYGRRVNNRNLIKATFDQYLTTSYQLLTGISASAEKILRQEIMIDAIEKGNPDYAATKALLQQRTTYAIAGDIAAKTLPLFKNIIEAIAYAMFIFVVVLALLPNGWRILIKYFELLIWTQLWAPLYAVLNLAMTLYGQNETMAFAKDKGLTKLTSLAIYSANADTTTLAAWLSISIPFLSYGLFKAGAGAFVSMAQSLGSAMQAASSGVAAETVSGNMSLGNVSLQTEAYQTKSAFQHNTSPSYSSGQMRSLGYDGMETVSYADGSTSYNDQGISQLPFEITATIDNSYAQQQQLTQAQELAKRDYTAANEAQSAAYDSTMSALKQIGQLYNINEDYTKGRSASEVESFQKVANLLNEIKEGKDLSTTQALEAMIGVQAGTSRNFIGGSIGGNLSGSATRNMGTGSSKSLSDSKTSNVSIDDVLTFGSMVTEHVGKSRDQNYSESAMASLNEARSLTKQSEISLAHLESLQNSITSTQQTGLSQSEKIGQKIIDYMAEHIGAAETQKTIREGLPAMKPWVERFLADHKEYKPGSVNIEDHRAALQHDYQSNSLALSSNAEAALKQDHAVAANNVNNISKKNDLDPHSFNVGTGVRKEVENITSKKHAEISNGRKQIEEGGFSLEKTVTDAETSSLFGALTGLKLKDPSGETPSFLSTSHDTPQQKEIYDNHVAEINAYKNMATSPTQSKPNRSSSQIAMASDTEAPAEKKDNSVPSTNMQRRS